MIYRVECFSRQPGISLQVAEASELFQSRTDKYSKIKFKIKSNVNRLVTDYI